MGGRIAGQAGRTIRACLAVIGAGLTNSLSLVVEPILAITVFCGWIYSGLSVRNSIVASSAFERVQGACIAGVMARRALLNTTVYVS